MAIAPERIQIQIQIQIAPPSAPPPPARPLSAEQIKARADEDEATIDVWLAKPKKTPPPYTPPFHVPEAEVLGELARRYQAAGWIGAHAKRGGQLVLDKNKPSPSAASAAA